MSQTADPPTIPAAHRADHAPSVQRRFRVSRCATKQVRALVDGRVARRPVWLLMVQFFIGLGWIRAAVEKIVSARWWSGAELSLFLDVQSGRSLGWYRPFLDLVVSRHTVVIAAVVLVLQLVAGTSLLAGRFVPVGLAAGILLNLNFVAVGAVNPSVFYLVSQGSIALWLAERSITARNQRWLTATSVAGAALALVSLPWVRTLAPANVIDDPAVMFVTGGVLAVVASEIALSRSGVVAVESSAGEAGIRRLCVNCAFDHGELPGWQSSMVIGKASCLPCLRGRS